MKLRARDRVARLFDDATFRPADETPGRTGYITGSGLIDGRKAYVSAIVPDEPPESLFDGLQSHLRLLEEILKNPAPLVLLMDLPGHQQRADVSPFPQDPAKLLAHPRGVGRWYYLHAQLSGKVPQVCVLFDRLGASLTFPVALCDAVVMLEDAGMSLGRPDVVERMTGEKVDYATLGGAAMHAKETGLATEVVRTEDEALRYVRRYLSFFPSASGAPLPTRTDWSAPSPPRPIADIIPSTPNKAFDVLSLIHALADRGDEATGGDTALALRAELAPEVAVALLRVGGKVTGVVANNSQRQGGIFFPASCRKVARFVSLCDAFGIPLVFLADSSGFMVGSSVERSGLIRDAALMLQTIANASVPKLSVAVRRDYSAGVYAMAGPGMNPERFVALPSAVISIYGQAVADALLKEHREQQEEVSRQEMLHGAEDPSFLRAQGLIDEIVPPERLRDCIIDFLDGKQDGSRASGRALLLV